MKLLNIRSVGLPTLLFFSMALGGPAYAQLELRFSGNSFKGGAKDLYGASQYGENVNFVYAAPTADHAVMEAGFKKPDDTAGLFLHLRARNDDVGTNCRIRIKLNDKALFEGPSGFASDRWVSKKFPIDPADLRVQNSVVIQNIETSGIAGMPPWFMVAECAIAPENFTFMKDMTQDFQVRLPDAKREFPEPLASGEKPGFAWRGTKGWLWKPEQYLAEIPYIAKCKMNFLMNCYGSMCDIENFPWGDPRCNRWYEPLPAEKKKAYEKVVSDCSANGITFCFSMNPNLTSSRFVNTGKPEDIDALWQHYEWMQGLGVKWFNISLDDITQGIDASGQSRVVNEILQRLRKKDPEAQMIFCPTFYWGDGTDDKAKPYLEIIARELDKDIYLFWTGDSVVGQITSKGAETYRNISNHKLFLWDNYPVNDAQPTMHLGPVVKRDKDLNKFIDGYMSNPLHSQNEINRIPMFTCADYAWNPKNYDASRSIGQAILHLEESAPGQQLLKELVEAYPGMLIYGKGGTGFNAVREQYTRIAAAPHSRYVAETYVMHIEELLQRFEKSFPNRYGPEKKTLQNDIAWAKKNLAERYDMKE